MGAISRTYAQKQTIALAATAGAALAMSEQSLYQAAARGVGLVAPLASGAYSEDGEYVSYYRVGDPIGKTDGDCLPIAP